MKKLYSRFNELFDRYCAWFLINGNKKIKKKEVMSGSLEHEGPQVVSGDHTGMVSGTGILDLLLIVAVLVWTLLLLLMWPLQSGAANYYISATGSDANPGTVSQPFRTLQASAGLLNPGDTVFVYGNGTYSGDIDFDRPGSAANRIVIKGIEVSGNKPILSGGTNTITFSRYPYNQPGGDYYILDGFEITGGTERGLYHQAKDLIVRNCVVHDCPNHGILGADYGAGNLTLEYVEVYHCGSGTQKHQLYIATDQENLPGSIFRMQFCYIHDGNGGNNLKSRAERNEIYYNWFENAYYHELELIGAEVPPPGLKREDADVVGNVIWDRRDWYLVRAGGDGTAETNGRYRFVNNTFISNSRAVFRLFDGIESIQMHNNVFYRDGSGAPDIVRDEATWATGSPVINGSKNWVESGAANVPNGTQWANTITGTNPLFENIAQGNLYPASNSPLRNSASGSITEPGGFEFPNPLSMPAYEPPAIWQGNVLQAVVRPVDPMDIGAYEARVTTGLQVENVKTDDLLYNYPNPFNRSTHIRFVLPEDAPVTLEIFDAQGKKVKSLIDNNMIAGVYNIEFDALDNPAGIYYCTLTSGARLLQTGKMILIK